MARPQNDEEYGDKLADDRAVNVRLGKTLRIMRLKSKTPAGDPVTFEWLAKVTALHHGSIRRFEKGESGMTVATLARLKAHSAAPGKTCSTVAEATSSRSESSTFEIGPFRDLCVIFFVASFVASFVDPIFTARDRHFSAELTPNLLG